MSLREQLSTGWLGYKRADGRKGIRNKILVIYTVECSAFVAREIARRCPEHDIDLIGFHGCTDNAYAIRMILALIRHPNIGAVLTVGLGCEYTRAETLAQKAQEYSKPAKWLLIQEHGGTIKSIIHGIQLVQGLANRLSESYALEQMTIADLVIGAECGGSDFTSGLAGNPLVGSFFDHLVNNQGTAIFEEIVEAIGLKDHLLERARNEFVRSQICSTYDKALAYCQAVHQFSVSPGNFSGGLSTIEEKSMGAIIKSGTKPIDGVIKTAQTPPSKGLWLLDTTPDPHWMGFGYTNPNDTEGLMALISCGAQIVFLVTGLGNVIGSAVAPVIKITGNSNTFLNMPDDMDFDAGRILTGNISSEYLTTELLALVLSICQGAKSKAELLGHKEYLIPYKHQNPISVKPSQTEGVDM